MEDVYLDLAEEGVIVADALSATFLNYIKQNRCKADGY